MAWTLEEIERKWLGGQHIELPAEDVLRAFGSAEFVRSRDWVMATVEHNGIQTPGLLPFLKVYSFGKRVQSILGVPGAETILQKLLLDDPSAEAEMAAVYLLKSRRPELQVEMGPRVQVGKSMRCPDFRVRHLGGWIYVEVTQLNSSVASKEAQQVLEQVSTAIAAVAKPFILEILFWRTPLEAEIQGVIHQSLDLVQNSEDQRRDLDDLVSIYVKTGDPAILVPTVIPDDDTPRMSIGQTFVGPNQANRQVIVRYPFADIRAEDVLTAEARQLPKEESNLIMVDVTRQQTAYTSWPPLIGRRFTTSQHTRVGAVILFSFSGFPTANGFVWAPNARIAQNPHARIPLPYWVHAVAEETRSEMLRLMGI